jgi:hypothetical protein
MIELKNSRTTYLGKASGKERYSLDACIGAVQMKEPGGEWQDIRPCLIRDADGWHIEGAPYHAEIKDDGTRLFCPDRNERNKYLRLPAPVIFTGLDKNVITNPVKLDLVSLPNQITMPAEWGEIRVIFSNTGMHFEVLFLKAPPPDIFGKDSPRLLLDAEMAGCDISTLLMSSSGAGIPAPRLVKDNGEFTEERKLDWSYKNGQMELGFDLGELGFPVLLKNTTIDVQVGASADDGKCYSGVFSTSDTTVPLGYSSGARHMFARWTGVTVSGTVEAAYVSLYIHQSYGGTKILKVYFVDEDNPAAPTSEAEFLADPLTTGTDWDDSLPAGGWRDSPSLVNDMQNYVDSYAISDDAVMAQIKDDGGSSGNYGNIRMHDYSGNTYGPKLHIEYTAGGGAIEKTAAETGSGADTRFSLLAGLTKSDSGTGGEQSLLASLILLLSNDTGAGLDATVARLAALLKTESGSGLESISGRSLGRGESGSGVDARLACLAAITQAETGSGLEQSLVTSFVAKLAAETGQGSDTAGLIARLAALESGSGVDTGWLVGLKNIFSGDLGTGYEALKAMVGTSGAGSDMKLPGRAGQVGMPSKGVSL